jgi:UDP-2,3-diacylglucosamine pyrophosphatase LpxH
VSTAAAGAPGRDHYVVSDLHLGRGKNPETKRHHLLETFFYDEDFRGFCGWIAADAAARGEQVVLVLAGDVFDLLRIEPDPAAARGGVEGRFAPPVTPDLATTWVREILAGHPVFTEALADLLAAGHEVVFLPGNHDHELQWDAPQAEVRRAVGAALAARGAAEGALPRLRFEPWFVHEPGRLWIEHGCQYDPENAFRFPLRRRLRPEIIPEVAQRDMPLGNFFQKFLYNAFGSITFIVPSSRANYRYFRFLLANQPRLLLRVARSHGRFLVQVLRRLARLPATGWAKEAEQAHQVELTHLAARSGLGDALFRIDALKHGGADAVRAASGMLRQGLKLVLGALLVAVLAGAVWASVWRAVDALRVGFGWKTLVTLALYLVFGTLTGIAVVAAALRLPTDTAPLPLRRAAERIAGILDVPVVAFGHTHDEGVWPLARPSGGPAWYFNTGTWIAVFTHDVLVPRERVQYTFLRIRGTEGELLQWSPGRGRPIPVVLLEEEAAHPAAGAEVTSSAPRVGGRAA